MDWNLYDRTLDGWAAQEREAAEVALRREDERARSMALMRASMCGQMLRALARQGDARLSDCAREMTLRAESARARDDHDSEERCLQQRVCVERARALLMEMEERA